MNANSASSSLRHFFAAYFHQDWDLEADDWQGIVDGYVSDEHPSTELLRALAQEIDDLCAAQTEPDLEHLVARTIGAYYDPRPGTYKDWLGQISTRLRQRAATIEDGSAPQR